MKNPNKRIIALILALAMVLSLSAPAWAAEQESDTSAAQVETLAESAAEEAPEESTQAPETAEVSAPIEESAEASSDEEDSSDEPQAEEEQDSTEEAEEAEEAEKSEDTEDLDEDLKEDEENPLIRLRVNSDENTVAAMQKKIDLLNLVDPDMYMDNQSADKKMTKEEIQTLQNEAKKAIAGCTSDYEKIEAINRYVATRIYYDYDVYKDRKPYKFETIYYYWNVKRGVCADYARLSQYLLRCVGISCVDLDGVNHAFNAAYDRQQSRWIIFDSTWCSGNTYSYDGNQEWKEGAYYGRYFDMNAQVLSQLDNHEINEIK